MPIGTLRALPPAQMRGLSPAARRFARSYGGGNASARWLVSLALLSLLAAFVVAFLACSPLKKAGLSDFDALGVISAIALVPAGLGAVAAIAAYRSTLPTQLVVWLRRFHVTGEDRFPLELMFHSLSSSGMLACTLRDTSVDRSDIAENVVANLAKIEAALRNVDASQSIKRAAMDAAERRAFGDMFVVSGAEAPTYFRTLRQNLRQRKSHIRLGFLVLRVADPDWQAVVEEALKEADAVLMDVSHISENIIWELNTLRERTPPGKIVFALGVDPNADWRTHPSCGDLQTIFGADWSERGRVFVHPARIDPARRAAIARNEMPRFLACFYEAVAS